MENWQTITLLICLIGFFREQRPSEPFITEFLTGPWRNVTEEQVNREIYPIGTYSYLVQLIFVFLFTDYLRYKPLIILSGISGIIIWSMLLWTKSLISLKILEIIYGTYMSTEIAILTYIYTKVEKIHYQKVTTLIRSSILFGHFISSILGQLLIYVNIMDYRELNFVTLAGQIIMTVFTLFLPNSKKSIYFNEYDIDYYSTDTYDTNKEIKINEQCNGSNDNKIIEQVNLFEINNKSKSHLENIESYNKNGDLKSINQKMDNKKKKLTKSLWLHIKNSYTNHNIIVLSIYYVITIALYLQIITYIQLLWVNINKSNSNQIVLNGIVDGLVTLICAIITLLLGYIKYDFNNNFLIINLFLLLKGVTIYLFTYFNNLYLSYLFYVIYHINYTIIITIINIELSKNLYKTYYGLIFGINQLFAVLLQTFLILTVLNRYLNFNIFEQYYLYSLFIIIISFIYFIIKIYLKIFSCIQNC